MTTVVALTRTAHMVPGVAVTLLTIALAATSDVAPVTLVALAVAVFSGQLVVGWTNDLLDLRRDRLVGRIDKPLAVGDIDPHVVTVATVITGIVCIAASMACGIAAGSVHLILGVCSGLAYNAGVKSTVFSWVPYLVAFGALPAVVMLAADPAHLPPAWMVVAAALLGVGAHLLNVAPDLDDDAAAGVRGLPHRLGRRGIPAVAAVLLVGATVVCVVATTPTWSRWAALGAAVVVVAITARAPGRVPFYGAMVVAGIDAAMLVFA